MNRLKKTKVIKENECENCQGKCFKKLFKVKGYDIARCVDCGLVFVLLDEDEPFFESYYQEEYFVGYEYLDYEKDKKIKKKNFGNFAKKLCRVLRPGKDKYLLEIGCAYGFFLEMAREYWTVKGIDISKNAAEYASKNLNLDAYCGDFFHVNLDKQRFDAVVMWDTIDHLRHPGECLRKIFNLLKDQGILVFNIGDFGSIVARIRGQKWRVIIPPSHLYYFDRNTIRDFLRRNGFQVIKIEYVGLYRGLVSSYLYGVLFKNKSALRRKIYQLLTKHIPIPNIPLYLNLKDIMLVYAKKIP